MKITRRPAFLIAISLAVGIITSYFMIKNKYFLSLKIILIIELIYFLFYLFFFFLFLITQKNQFIYC